MARGRSVTHFQPPGTSAWPSARPTPRGTRLVHARLHVTPAPANRHAGIWGAKRGPASSCGGRAAGRERDSPAPALPASPPPPPAAARSHVRGKAQGGGEDRKRPHQPESGRAGWLRRPVQNQETHAAEQADEGVLREAGLVNETD